MREPTLEVYRCLLTNCNWHKVSSVVGQFRGIFSSWAVQESLRELNALGLIQRSGTFYCAYCDGGTLKLKPRLPEKQ